MRHTDHDRKNARPTLCLLAGAALAACAGAPDRPEAPAAPEARAVGPGPEALVSDGYDAPDLEQGREPASYRSVAYADPPPAPRGAAPAPRSAYFAPAVPAEAPLDAVPPAPRAAYAAPRRPALPDLDEIVVTDAAAPPRRYASAEQAFADETRSVMDDVRRPEAHEAEAYESASGPSPAPKPTYGPVPAARSEGGYALHLASYRETDQAMRGWDVLTAEHPGLASLTPRRTRIDLPDQGAFVRLIAGPFASDAAAEGACASLEAEGGYCAVVPFGGAPL